MVVMEEMNRDILNNQKQKIMHVLNQEKNKEENNGWTRTI